MLLKVMTLPMANTAQMRNQIQSMNLDQHRQIDDHEIRFLFSEINVESREEQVAALPPPLHPSQQPS